MNVEREPSLPSGDPPAYTAATQPPSSASRSSRRARVDEEEDEDDQRQTNRQRMHAPLLDSDHPSNDHHFHPDMHLHAQQHREQQQQAAQPNAANPQRPPLPFNRISFTVDILPILGAPTGAPAPAPAPAAHAAPAGNPQQPTQGRAVPPVFFELRMPFPPPSPADGPQGDEAHAQRTPNDFANAFLHALQMGNMPWGQFPGFSAEEPDDPGRAKRLLSGLEQVPEGLVKRMERVGMVEGEQVVCAICFDSLLKTEDAEAAEDKMEIEVDSTSSPLPSRESASDSADTTMDEERKAAEELDGKIVVLPCAHVFHASCLRPWFTRPHRTTCPTCRFDIDPESLTYVPPSRRPRPRQPTAHPAEQAPAAGPANAPQPQSAEPAAAPTANNAPNAAGLPPQAGAGAAAHSPPDAGRDMPYIIFDVNMLVPFPHPPRAQGPVPSQQQPAPATGSQPPVYGPPPPPSAAARPAPVSQPGIVRMDRQQLEQLILNRPPPQSNQAPSQDANQAAPQPAPQAQPHPQPQPQPAQPRPGSRPFWQPFPLGTTPTGVRAGGAPQGNAGTGSGLGNLFANIFHLGRGNPQPPAQAQPTQPQAQEAPQQPQAGPAPAPQPHAEPHHHYAHPPLPSFEEFIHLAGLGTNQGRPDGQAQPRPHQPAPAPGDAPQQQQHPHPHPPQPSHAHQHNDLFMDGVREFATSVLEQLFPAGVFVPLPARPGAGAAQPPPPGPIPFNVPQQPRAPQPPPEKRQWTPPAPPGPTLRERVERKERELGLRCSDISCGLGPSDEDPLPVVDPRTIRQVALRPPKGQEARRDRVCEHTFHPACLVSAERVAGWSGADQKREVEDGEEEVQVSCPVCRAVGVISREDWDEGACALA